MVINELFSTLETHFNTSTDIIPVIQILRGTDISVSDICSDNTITNTDMIFINDIFKVCIITWPTNVIVKHILDNNCVFKILKGEMNESIKSNHTSHILEHVFNTGYTGYMPIGVSYISTKYETVSIHIYSF